MGQVEPLYPLPLPVEATGRMADSVAALTPRRHSPIERTRLAARFPASTLPMCNAQQHAYIALVSRVIGGSLY